VSEGTAAAFRTLAFGDLGAGAWGCAWGDPYQPVLAVGATRPGAPVAASPATISGSAPGEDWAIAGEGVELTVSPESEPVSSPAIGGFDQLCRVRGRAAVGGADREIDLPGRRGSRSGLEMRQFDSFREVSAWFAPGEGISLTSLRPHGAKGHDRDVLAASVFEPEGAHAVADPRLSTTYAADGHPIKFGLELWLDGDESEQQYPRRAAGASLGPSAAWTQPPLDLAAYVARCRGRGEEGLGVYVLGRSR
jgi:hypothetical protein